ncbi:MAG TPA: GAF domain-containing protein [Pirellulales bacterium]|jgi:L-methionine (R)-S-oxide reductase|nr:GAF domain-containing protein [Pirellulales bacterium]
MDETRSPWAELLADERALLAEERDFLANMANCAALLFCGLDEVNWAGFYLLKRGQLVLGPFQGRPACVRIDLGRGVCGTAAARRETILVLDVHHFAGHIACDERSRSEVVVPLIVEGQVLGVLDLDSPRLGRFDGADASGLEEFVRVLLASSELSEIALMPQQETR